MTETQHADTAQLAEARERVERMVTRYVKAGRYVLNPDPVTVNHVVAGLTRNLLRWGHWYCPCREVTGRVKEDRMNICPCPQHHADIAREGVCECGIFVSREFAANHTRKE
jgi:ferredoxin-thioredoxin reductase catalytic subunit